MKRKILTTAAAVLLAIAAACSSAPSPTPLSTPIVTQRASSPVISFSYLDVLNKKITPAEYVAYLVTSTPELVEARRQGVLQGLYYNPSAKELGQIVTAFVSQFISPNEPDFKNHVELVTRFAYNQQRNHDMSTIYEFTTSGEGYAAPIIVWDAAFKDLNFVTSADFEDTLIEHELKGHASDYNSRSDIADLVENGDISAQFAYHINEIHALAPSIQKIMMPSSGFSYFHKAKLVADFATNMVLLCPSSQFEADFAKQELDKLPFRVIRDGKRLTAIFPGQNEAFRFTYSRLEIPECK